MENIKENNMPKWSILIETDCENMEEFDQKFYCSSSEGNLIKVPTNYIMGIMRVDGEDGGDE